MVGLCLLLVMCCPLVTETETTVWYGLEFFRGIIHKHLLNFEFLTLKEKLLYLFLFPSLNVWSWGWPIVHPKHTRPCSWVCMWLRVFYLQKLSPSLWGGSQPEDAAVPPCPRLPGLCFSLTFNFHLPQIEKYLAYWFWSSRGRCSAHVRAQCVC